MYQTKKKGKLMENDPFKDFDKQFNKMAKAAVGIWVAGVCLSLSLLGFGIWAVVQVMEHFGVV